ncbi:MAG: NADH:flavin oxidoreductase [archaeon GB-1867-035]|nr:NADH:flavin oxidoreductase [Candidatus Culexmicrobium profundum]
MQSLLSTLKVRGFQLKNRIVMPPMATELATEEGHVTDELIEHYVNRCKYLGLLIIEHSYVSIEGKISPRQLGIYNDKLIDGLKQLVNEVHKYMKPVVIQINHGGGKASSKITGIKPIAPSPIMVPGGVEEPKEMTLEDIERVLEAFEKAAKRAIEAGFDGVEIHGAHGFLLNQFTSPITNKRLDAYGRTMEGRFRFPLEVVEKIRKVIGNKLLLYRLGADDMMPGGLTIKESRIFAAKLESLGVDIIDVSGGLCGSRPAHLTGQGYFIPLAEKIREVVEIPVIGVGGIKDPEFADKVIREGRVDLVAIGREMLRDPKWAEKAVNKLKGK